MSVGENIRKFRKQKGLTQKKLGELSNINEVQIRQYELGKANPKIETIEKIANALEVNVMALLSGSFTLYKDAYHKTTEYKEIERHSTGFYATLKLLECIYKQADDVNVEAYQNGILEYSSNYISIGSGTEKIAISNSDFDKIIHILKSTLTSLVDLIGENESRFIENWKREEDISSLSFSVPESPKILLLDENGKKLSYSKPF